MATPKPEDRTPCHGVKKVSGLWWLWAHPSVKSPATTHAEKMTKATVSRLGMGPAAVSVEPAGPTAGERGGVRMSRTVRTRGPSVIAPWTVLRIRPREENGLPPQAVDPDGGVPTLAP